MRTPRRTVPALLGLGLLLGGCGSGSIDWKAPENLVLRERSGKVDDGVKLEYWSLIDAPAGAVYAALADVAHYPDFVPGVDGVSVLSVEGNTTVTQISQRVIGRQTNAKVEWKFFPDRRRIEFRTLSSNLSYNDGSFVVTPSPDGKRSLVESTYLVKQGEAQAVPIGVLASGTRESFLAAAQGVRKRAGASAKPAA